MSINDFITAVKELHISVLLIGAAILFILIALVGGGIKGVIEVPAISAGQRRVMGIIGVIFLLLGIIGAALPSQPTANPTPTPVPTTPTASPTPTPVPTTPTASPTPTPVPTTPTANPTWKVILNRSYNTLTYKNYTVNDTQGHHFLIVNTSFENVSSTTRALSGKLFDLKDENGNDYSADQASTPEKYFAVEANQSSGAIETAFVVPNSSCQFKLFFVDSSGTVEQRWDIHSSYCS